MVKTTRLTGIWQNHPSNSKQCPFNKGKERKGKDSEVYGKCSSDCFLSTWMLVVSQRASDCLIFVTANFYNDIKKVHVR